MELINATRWAVQRGAFFDLRGAEHLVFALKAGFELAEDGALRPATERVAIQTIEAFTGEPGVSSVRAEAELGPPKPATDCVLTGHAVTAREGDREVLVRFVVGDAGGAEVASALALVRGRRLWRKSGEPGAPEPFDRIPLVWERAFGGSDDTPDDPDKHEWVAENPIGAGLVAEGSKRAIEEVELPSIEDPRALLASLRDRPKPVGFGFVARHWQPRASFAGTYDEAWQRERMPLLPLDFDARFHQAAPRGLIAPRLSGGERVVAEGVSRSGPLRFALPRPSLYVVVRTHDGERRVPLAIDTLHLDADRLRVSLLFKGALATHGFLDDVTETRFEGEISL